MPPATAVLGLGEKLLLLLSFVLFVVVVLLQTWGASVLGSLAGIWLLASRSLLKTGGLALTDGSFRLGMLAGAGLAALSVLGSVARRVVAGRRPELERQRVIGPGGRVLRVFFTPVKEPATHPILSWIPDAATLLFLYFMLVRGLKWSGSHWMPAGLCCALILANLYLFCLYLPLWLTRLHIGIFRHLYRFARGSGFRAGAVTVALLGLVGWMLRTEVVAVSNGTPHVAADWAHELDLEQPASAIQREILFGIADDLWPEPAFEAGLQRFLAPLFDAASDPYDSQLGLRLAPERPRPTLLAMLGGAIAAEDPTDADQVFRQCVLDLHPTLTSRAERHIISGYRQLKRADGYDIAIQALLNVCHNHSTKGLYPKLESAFWLAVGREAKKRVDPTRKYRREISESALGAPGVDCDADFSDYVDRCPSPYDSVEQRLAAQEELAQIKWQDLNRLQCTVILQKAVLRWTDQEIADAHTGMTSDKAKNIYQNARKKIRDKLAGTCLGSPDFSLPRLRERVPARDWPPGLGEIR